MTQLESSVSPSANANSTGAVLCSARNAGTLWTSTLARPPRRRNGWIRPDYIETSLSPSLQTSWLRSTRSLHAHLPPHSTGGCHSFDLRTWNGPEECWCPGWFLSSRKELTGDVRNELAPCFLPPPLDGRRESGWGRGLQSNVSCTKNTQSRLIFPFPCTAFLTLLVNKRKGI